MALIPVPKAGSIGVLKDLSQADVPLGAWTDAKNIRFLDGYAQQAYGYGEVYGTIPIVPHHLMPVVIGTQRYWLYASLQKAYVATITGGVAVHTNITRQTAGADVDYAATPNSWTSTLLGGIPVLNPGNKVDPPQQWSLNPAARMTALANWPSNCFARSLRGYKNYLVALSITKGAPGSQVEYPFMVKWSHPADPGGVPVSWDITDPTRDAGEFDLAEGYDPIIDGLQLRDSFMIYKQASIWRMDFTGGPFVFSFKKVLGTSGALNRNCIVELDGFHLVLTGSDVIVHDGQTSTSVLDKVTRRALFQSIDTAGVDRCFVFKNPFLNEAFICYPEIGSDYCNKAVVWNYVDKTVSFRDIPNLNHAAFGPVDNSLEGLWSQDNAPWASDLTAWNGPDYTPSTARAMMGSMDQKLFLLDASASFNGAIPQALLERRGESFGAPESIKLYRGCRPIIDGNTGDTVIFQAGGQSDPWAEPVWGPEITHTIGQTVADDCMVSGRYIAFRFKTGTAFQWRLTNLSHDVQVQGGW